MTVEQKFAAWQQTPGYELVMGHFRRLAAERLRRGRPFGMKAIAEVVRWEIGGMDDVTVDGYKVNNNFITDIGRVLIAEMPGLVKLVQIRKRACERQKFPGKWMSQVKGTRRIPTARLWPTAA